MGRRQPHGGDRARPTSLFGGRRGPEARPDVRRRRGRRRSTDGGARRGTPRAADAGARARRVAPVLPEPAGFARHRRHPRRRRNDPNARPRGGARARDARARAARRPADARRRRRRRGRGRGVAVARGRDRPGGGGRMRHVNLLPADAYAGDRWFSPEKGGVETTKRILALASAATGLVLVLLGGLYIHERSIVNDRQETLTALE